MILSKAYRLHFFQCGMLRLIEVIYAPSDKAAVEEAEWRAVFDDIEVFLESKLVRRVRAHA
jgi:hypothetical protein